MENAIKKLKEIFIEKHGDLKLSGVHNFIGHERGRTDTHVIVGYSYNFFNSAKTVLSQYLIPIEEWDDPKIFVAFKDYVTNPPGGYFKDWFHCISFDLSLKAFEFNSDVGRSCEAERNAWKKPPYESDDLPPHTDPWDDYYFDDRRSDWDDCYN